MNIDIKENHFFKVFKPILVIKNNNSPIIPTEFFDIYASDLKNNCGGLTWNKKTGVEFNDEIQIIKFENPKNAQFQLKRRAVICKHEKTEDILNDETCLKIINQGICDYLQAKLISAHPFGIIPYGFEITKLTSLGILVTEYIMEDAGNPLKIRLGGIKQEIGRNQKRINILKQTADILSFIEMLRILFIDVKPENFVSTYEKENESIRIVDYTSTNILQYKMTLPIKRANLNLEICELYASPEIKLIMEKKNEEELDNVNLWKANVYSWGLMALYIFEAITTKDLQTIDKFQKDPVLHNKYIDLLLSRVALHDHNLTLNIQNILQVSLDFDPDKRIPFKQLSALLKEVDKTENELFKTKIIGSVRRGYLSRYELNKEISKLEAQVRELQQDLMTNQENQEKLQKTINELLDDRKEFFRILRLQKLPNYKINERGKVSKELENVIILFQSYTNEDEVTIKNLYDIQYSKSPMINQNLGLLTESNKSIDFGKNQDSVSISDSISMLQRRQTARYLNSTNFKSFKSIQEKVTKSINKDSQQIGIKDNIIVDESIYLKQTEEEKKSNQYLFYVKLMYEKCPDILQIKILENQKIISIDLYMNHQYNDAALHKNCIYYNGGKKEKTYLDTSAIINLDQYKVKLKHMTEPKSNVSLVSTTTTIFALGGYNGTSLSSCEFYKFETGLWERTLSLNFKNSWITSFFDNPFIYVLGGKVSGFYERLNLQYPTKWEILNVFGSSKRSFGCCKKINNDEILIFGGDLGPLEFSVFNTKNLTLSKGKRKFVNEWFNSSKPIFWNNCFWVCSYLKVYKIQISNLNWQSKKFYQLTN